MVKSTRVSVSIGIPAYNEEKNIKNLLQALINQREEGFFVKEIIVIDDGSTDKTLKKIKEVKNKKVKTISHSRRLGQIHCQNKIFDLSSSDIVVLLEADTIPKDSYYLSNLIKPIKDNQACFVQGKPEPLQPATFIEKVIALETALFHKISLQDGVYRLKICSGRGGRAFCHHIYRQLRWPANAPEDVYSLLWIEKNHMKIALQEKAVCGYRCAQTLSDLVKERQKTHSAQTSLERYFFKNSISLIYQRPLLHRIKAAVFFSVNNPIHFIAYLGIKVYLRLRIKKREFSDLWPATITTKQIFTL